MSEADAEDRNLAQDRLDVLLRVGDRRGIGRSVREEHAVGLHLEDRFRRRLRRHDRDTGELREVAQDVRLHAEVVAHDVGKPLLRRPRGEFIRTVARHLRGVVLPVKSLPLASLLDRPFFILLSIFSIRADLFVGDVEIGTLVAVVAQMNRQRTRVDPVDAWHARVLEVLVKRLRGTEVRRLVIGVHNQSM